MTPLAVRWLKFNVVGALGIVVQMGAFALLFSALHLNYMVATALAVETAVLHNFVWHELYTWKHLPRGAARDVALAPGALPRRQRRDFHPRQPGPDAPVRRRPAHPSLRSQRLAIALCSLLNFAASEWFVFRK